jgi:hypothetical protein
VVAFFESESEPAVFLDFSEEAFDTLSEFVDGFVIQNRHDAIFSSRHHGDVILRAQLVAMCIAIVAHVLNHVAAVNFGGERIGVRNIGGLACGEESFHHVKIAGDGQMQLRGYARAVAAFRLLPPFCPPP